MEPNNLHSESRLPKKHPYTVPEGYFDKLPMRIQQRVQQEQTARGFWQLPVFRPQVLRYAVAAVLVLVAGLWLVLRQAATPANPAETPIALAELTDAEVATYLTANYHQLETADIAELTLSDEMLPQALPALEPQDLADEIDYVTLDEYYL